MLVEAERQALTVLNATERAPLPQQTVVDMFDARAAREPHSVALRQGRAELTFAALKEKSDALAAILLAHGLRPGDRVAIAGRRSMLAVIAMLATSGRGRPTSRSTLRHHWRGWTTCSRTPRPA